jgi:type IV pilus assembly protein PilA
MVCVITYNMRLFCFWRRQLLGCFAVITLLLVTLACSSLGVEKMNANELVVIREIQTINQAQTQYISQFGKYASTLRALGPPTSGAPGLEVADLIPSKLASGENDGYVFTLTTTQQGYTINANPRKYPDTGKRTFFSDQTMTIHQNWSAEPANASSPELK